MHPALTRLSLALPSFALAAVALGCAAEVPGKADANTPLQPGQPVPGYVGEDAKVAAESLQFADPLARARFEAAQSCFQRRGGAKGWVRFPLREIGSFVRQDWCRGEGAERGCRGGWAPDQPGFRSMDVHVLAFDLPEAFGTGVSVKHNSADGWSMGLSVHDDGRNILGDGLYLNYRRGEESVFIGTETSFDLLAPLQTEGEHAQVGVAADEAPWELLDRLRASPDALLEFAVGQQEALMAAGLEQMTSTPPKRCVYGESDHPSIEPPCVDHVDLTTEELETVRAALQSEGNAAIALLRANHVRFHALLLEDLGEECLPSTESLAGG